MSVIHITGLRHHWVQEPDTDKASALVEEKLRQLPLGTLLLLQLEPNNPVTPAMGEDKGAVAVYDEQYNRIGYVNKTFRLQLHKHMNEYTLLEARYAGSDGHVTMYANVDDLEDMSVTLDGLTRKLPAASIPPLEYTPEEERLRVMTHSLLKPDLTTLEGAGRYLSLVRSYLPLSAISLCSEDSLLRCQVINNLSELMKRKEPFDAGQQQEACELRKQLNATEGDFHRRPDESLEQLLRRHLDTLRRQASAADERAFFHRFDALYKDGLRAKLDELEVWLKQLPWTTAYDRHNLGRLADGLVIMNLTRRDLYDVCAVLLLLERDELQQLDGRTNQPLSDREQAAYNQLEGYVRKGRWQSPATEENMLQMMDNVLALGTMLTKEDEALSDQLWKLLSERKGNSGRDAVRLTWANLAGYFLYHGLLKGDTASLSNDFFGNREQANNINKGKPGNSTNAAFRAILPLLDRFRPKG